MDEYIEFFEGCLGRVHRDTGGWGEAIAKATEHIGCHQVVRSVRGRLHLRVFDRCKKEGQGWIHDREVEPDLRQTFVQQAG